MKPSYIILNPGSSSLKACVFIKGEPVAKYTALLTDKQAYYTKDTQVVSTSLDNSSLNHAFEQFITLVQADWNIHEFTGAALRVVFPGSVMKNAVVRITKHRRETLEDTRDEAPLHNGPMLDLVTYLQKHYPDLPIYGVSDSYFHHTIPQWRRLSGITFKEKTYLQHGYHGLSLASSVKQLKKQCSAHKTLFPKRIIIAHLGSGSSITGLLHGKSMITSMGYTPLDGICMATRPGHVDSGIILSMIHEMIEGKEDSEEIYQHLDTQLHQKSGLLALAGTKDMKYIVDHRAKEPYTSTLNHYCDQCIEMIGGYATVLGGVDMLVFSGGIGEHSSYIRKRIIKGIKKIFPAIKTRVIIIDEEQEMYDELCIANHKKK